MFSITTIESSTTRPIAMVSAPSVMMLSEYPKASMPMKVMSTQAGIEIAVTRVERTDSRKTRITITAKRSPSSSLGGERVDGLLDEGRLVEHDGELRAVAEGLLEVGQGLPHRLRRRRPCCRRGLRDRDRQRRARR